MTSAQRRTKTGTSISRKICCVKREFQILYAVEQFRLTIFKRQVKARGTHTKPMIRLPRACHVRTAVRFPANSSHMCSVELALKALLLPILLN